MPGHEIFGMPSRWPSKDGLVFDAIELAPMLEIDDEGTVEQVWSLVELSEAERERVTWSIFGHMPGRGLECIGDFESRDLALDVIRMLLGDLRPYDPPHGDSRKPSSRAGSSDESQGGWGCIHLRRHLPTDSPESAGPTTPPARTARKGINRRK